jgi:hypothetical protein
VDLTRLQTDRARDFPTPEASGVGPLASQSRALRVGSPDQPGVDRFIIGVGIATAGAPAPQHD